MALSTQRSLDIALCSIGARKEAEALMPQLPRLPPPRGGGGGGGAGVEGGWGQMGRGGGVGADGVAVDEDVEEEVAVDEGVEGFEGVEGGLGNSKRGGVGECVCYGCGGLVGAEEGVEASGRVFHAACFTCKACAREITGAFNFAHPHMNPHRGMGVGGG